MYGKNTSNRAFNYADFGMDMKDEPMQSGRTASVRIQKSSPTGVCAGEKIMAFGMKFNVPEEKDYHLRRFSVMNPESELFEIDTASDPNFKGPVWTRILASMQRKDDFLRGRVWEAMMNKQNRFCGYKVSIDGVMAFLPLSRACWFYNNLYHDASRKCIAVKVVSIDPKRPRTSLVVEAESPWRYVVKSQGESAFSAGQTPYALAMDFDKARGGLVFPLVSGKKAIICPLEQAQAVARRKGFPDAPDFLTGCCWRIRIISNTEPVLQAEPLDILL